MTPEERKSRERQQRSEHIVDTAQDIFFAKGFDATTVQDIATAAGYTKRNIYLYFKDKETLFLAVVQRGLQRLLHMLENAEPARSGPGTGLRRFALAFYEFSLRYPDFLDLIMIYEARYFIYQEKQRRDSGKHCPPGSMRDSCQKLSAAVASLITRAIEAGLRKGTIQSSLTSRQLMLILWGQVVGMMKILQIRETAFHQSFGIRREELFAHFIRMTESVLVHSDRQP